MTTILDEIVGRKQIAIEKWKKRIPLEELQRRDVDTGRDFTKALREARPGFILECKRASPSKGRIRENLDLGEVASVYGKYATCISVLTEEDHFDGSLEHLTVVRNFVTQPILCKDFFVDPWQVYAAKSFGADAILLMLSVLSDETYADLSRIALQLKMAVLTEVSTEAETNRALQMGAQIIGINNRNLKDLTIDLDRTRQMAPSCRQQAIVISESGFSSRKDVEDMLSYVDGFLIGSALMASDDLESAVREMVLGGTT
jgi:indole-3-glycerol phosphate synthase/phosphoribosylanthranilate isomerase